MKQSGTDIPPMIKFLYTEQAKIAPNERKIEGLRETIQAHKHVSRGTLDCG